MPSMWTALALGLDQVAYEPVSLAILSTLYFAIGAWIFQRRQMRAV